MSAEEQGGTWGERLRALSATWAEEVKAAAPNAAPNGASFADQVRAFFAQQDAPTVPTVEPPPNGDSFLDYGRAFFAQQDAPNGQQPTRRRAPAVVGDDLERRARAWAQAKLEGLTAELAAEPKGRRNDLLNSAAYSLGRYVHRWLDEQHVVDALTAAALTAGLEPRETARTIASGLEAGKREPLDPPVDDRGSLEALAGLPPRQAPDSAPRVEGGAPSPMTALEAERTLRRLVVTPASAIAVQPVQWLWQDRIPLGSLSLLAGREGIGKSTVGYQLAAQLTRGRLPGRFYGTPKAVVVAATEDSWAHTIVPRLIAADADLDLILRVDVDTAEHVRSNLSLPRDTSQLAELIGERNVALVLLDPLMSRLESRLDSHKDAEVRLALEPLVAVADKTGVAVLGIIHVNKGKGADALDRVMGSRAFTAVARSVQFVLKDPDDDSRRLLGTPKNNLGRADTLPTLAFTIDTATVAEHVDGPVLAGRIRWCGEVSGTIDDALEASEDGSDTRTATSEAADWLVDWLTTQGGEAAHKDIKAAGLKAGHTLDALKRARKRAKIAVRSYGFPRQSIWSLPGAAIEPTGQATQ